MAREAILEINCGRYSKDIYRIIALLGEIGWKHFSEDGIAEYLPENDADGYNWQKGELSEAEFSELIRKKQAGGERVGVVLYHRSDSRGITMLAKSTEEILLDINIDRKTTDGHRESITDFGWYMTNIVEKMVSGGCPVDHVRFEDYTD